MCLLFKHLFVDLRFQIINHLKSSSSMKTEDFKIVNGGRRDKIDFFNEKYFLVFVSGSGSGDQSYWFSSTSVFDVYKNVSGKLILSGRIVENHTTDSKHFSGTINGIEISLPLLATEIFSQITDK